DIYVPLPLLETWMSIERADPNFISAAEQQASLPRLREFFGRQNRLSADGVVIPTTLERVSYFCPEADKSSESPAPRRLGAWTCRIAATVAYRLEHAKNVELTWTLFNNAVLSADALIHENGATMEHQLSTYDPRVPLR